MKITIEIAVEIDGPITAGERKELQAHLLKVVKQHCVELGGQFSPEPRMLGTVCRFAFGKITSEVQ